MKEIIRKEYEASVDELKELFPIGTICYIDNKTARVIEINEPAGANCMASYPSVTFVVVEPGISMDTNKLHPTAHAADCTGQMINAAEIYNKVLARMGCDNYNEWKKIFIMNGKKSCLLSNIHYKSLDIYPNR